VITAVHCDTPSGMLQPVHLLGPVARDCGALLVVDVVASAFSTPVAVRDWGVDVALLGTQKCLGAHPDLGIALVGAAAWERAAAVAYRGYDALLPFRDAAATGAFPYTPNWAAVAALGAAVAQLEAEGLVACIARHGAAAAHAQARLVAMGLRLVVETEAARAPSATAAWLPAGCDWARLDAALRARGVVLGGSYEALAGRVVRLGHMGAQAQLALVDRACDALQAALRDAQPRLDCS
jgi:aspartate aminotransferase-like enzyme